MKTMKQVVMISLMIAAGQAMGEAGEWPVLKHYDENHLSRIAMPIGGIGTGTVSLGGKGDLRDWEIMNWPGKGFYPASKGAAPFFAIYAKPEGGEVCSKALLGPLEDYEYHHFEGRNAANFGFPRFKSASFDAAYPLAQVNLVDDTVPVQVKIKGFNPLVPGDADASGIPIMVLTYEVTNPSDVSVDVAIAGCVDNLVGMDGTKRGEMNFKGEAFPIGYKDNRNEFRKGDGFAGIYMYSDGVASNEAAWGTMTLSVKDQGEVSYQLTSSAYTMWFNLKDHAGVLPPQDGGAAVQKPVGVLASKQTLAAGETKAFTFYLTWHFPNRSAWDNRSVTVGNYYTTQYVDAWDVMEKEFARLPELEEKTVDFISAFVNSDLDESVKEAALFNVSTLRSQTVFRTPDGKLFGWEGMADTKPMGVGNCTHVWNYEMTLPYLFGDLAKGMRDTEFNYATDERGLMSFRIGLPLESNASAMKQSATDGQMGSIMRFFREWELSGDQEFLEKGWPNVKRALEFAWIKNGWDGDQDGLMEGCLHNTMDIEFFGPHPELQFWYLGALRAVEKMALAMGEEAFSAQCASLFESGSKLTDETIFNGEYYYQIIEASCEKDEIPEGLRAGYLEPDVDVHHPNYQLGTGCQTDQLAGQTMAYTLNLGHLADPANLKKALQSIVKYNHLKTLENHLTTTRGYALGDEAGLIVASWPLGDMPAVPFPYSSEVWSGLEYNAAAAMMYQDMETEALDIVHDARARSNGSRRNPFNEMEFGNHYVRAMAAWGLVIAESGFHFSAVEESMEFSGKPGRYFWSNGYAWGTCIVKAGGEAVLAVNAGELSLNRFTLKGEGTKQMKKAKTIKAGDTVKIHV